MDSLWQRRVDCGPHALQTACGIHCAELQNGIQSAQGGMSALEKQKEHRADSAVATDSPR
jgi:hypothetical protein